MDRVDGCESLETAVELGMQANPRIDRDALAYRLLHAMRQREDRRLYWKQDRQRMSDYEYFMRKIAEIERLAPRICAPVVILRGTRMHVPVCARPFDLHRKCRSQHSGIKPRRADFGNSRSVAITTE